MATITSNQDGTLTVTLTAQEQSTVGMLAPGQLSAYMTIWLAERGKDAIFNQITQLSPKDQTMVLQTISSAIQASAQPVLSAPVSVAPVSVAPGP